MSGPVAKGAKPQESATGAPLGDICLSEGHRTCAAHRGDALVIVPGKVVTKEFGTEGGRSSRVSCGINRALTLFPGQAQPRLHQIIVNSGVAVDRNVPLQSEVERLRFRSAGKGRKCPGSLRIRGVIWE